MNRLATADDSDEFITEYAMLLLETSNDLSETFAEFGVPIQDVLKDDSFSRWLEHMAEFLSIYRLELRRELAARALPAWLPSVVRHAAAGLAPEFVLPKLPI